MPCMQNWLMDIKDAERLHEIKFNAYIKHGIIWVVFQAPAISKLLHNFLEEQDFVIFIDEQSGKTAGVWVSGPYPVKEYKSLRETFRSYGVMLPPLLDLQEEEEER